MAQPLDDNDFSDDGFDDIPANTLNDIEQNARLSTQQTQSAFQVADRRSDRAKEPLFATRNHSAATVVQDDDPPSDYGFEEEEVIDLDAPHSYFHEKSPQAARRSLDAVTQREQWRQQRYGAPSRHLFPHQISNRAGQINAAADLPISANTSRVENSVEHSTEQETDINVLRARIFEAQQLEQEKTALKRSVEDAQSTVLSKAGEIAIVRANQDKSAKEYERRLAALRSTHAEEVAKQKAELDMVKKNKETVETNNRFLEHDLAQEAEKARNARKSFKENNDTAAQSRSGGKQSPFSTPKKNKTLPFRDGFDDDEVMVSPSRSFDKSRAGTPRAAGKRKRQQIEKQAPSPSQALQMSGSERVAPLEQSETPTEATTSFFKTVEDTSGGKFNFIQDILNHRETENKDRTLEILTRHTFPSEPAKSLSSIIYDQFSEDPSGEDVELFRTRFCESMLTLWSRCLDENFYAPLYDITELLQYILIVSSPSLSTSLLPRLVPLCLSTADLIVFPTAKASKNLSLHDPPSPLLKSQIDPLDYLDLLHLTALNCSLQRDELTNFWTAIPFDFILTMLHKAQPLSQILRMLQLLSTSILPSSFGAILPNAGPGSPQQTKIELDTIDRLTVLLFETPLPTPAPPPPASSPTPTNPAPAAAPYPATSLLHLRTASLSLLTALAHTPHGGHLLATHRLAFARLVRFLHESLLHLYAYRRHTHPTTTAHVNATTLLLAHLVFAHPDALDIRARLAAMPGAAHRHLVALSRVAFGEGAGAIEAGIEAEAAEAAHRMLDVHLSPEEGEAVVEVFSSARG